MEEGAQIASRCNMRAGEGLLCGLHGGAGLPCLDGWNGRTPARGTAWRKRRVTSWRVHLQEAGMLGVGDVLDRIVGSKSGYNGWGPKDGLACPELNSGPQWKNAK